MNGFDPVLAALDANGRGLCNDDDANAAAEVFELLMGSDVAPRKEFIVQGAYEVDVEALDA